MKFGAEFQHARLGNAINTLSSLPGPEARLKSIDILRGIAALAVMSIHIPHHAYGGWRQNPFFFLDFLFDYGYVGVPCFIVISGFCIHRRSALKSRIGEHGIDWARFWKRRFWRLYPTYLAAIVFSLTLALFHTRYDWKSTSIDVGLHVLMIHNLTSEFATGCSNGVFWTLGMEEQLYALYIPLLLLMTWTRKFGVFTVLVITFMWRCLYVFEFLPPGSFLGSWQHWPFAYWFHWGLGALTVDAYVGNVSLPNWCRSLKVALALAVLAICCHSNAIALVSQTRWGNSEAVLFAEKHIHILQGLISDLLFPIAFFCLMNFGLMRESNGGLSSTFWNPFELVGRISYSIYLVHVPVIYLLDEHTAFGTSPVQWLLKYAIYATASLLAGGVFYLCVERHFLSRGSSRSLLKSPRPGYENELVEHKYQVNSTEFESAEHA